MQVNNIDNSSIQKNEAKLTANSNSIKTNISNSELDLKKSILAIDDSKIEKKDNQKSKKLEDIINLNTSKKNVDFMRLLWII